MVESSIDVCIASKNKWLVVWVSGAIVAMVGKIWLIIDLTITGN